MPKLLNAINRCGRAFSPSSVNDVPLLILLGPPRSNSTLIHRLLALHSAVVAPPLKELVFPGTLGGLFRTALTAVPQPAVDRFYNPQIHSTGADAAEADDIALLAAFSEGVFAWAYDDALKGECQPEFLPDKHLSYLSWLRGYLSRKYPGKTVCSKYFGGVHHFEQLRQHCPSAKFVLLYRDPRSVCYSLSSQLEFVLGARGVRIANPTQYWTNIYRYVVHTYAKMEEVAAQGAEDVLIVWDADVKSNLPGALDRISRHAGLPPNQDTALALKLKSSKGPYKRAYTYSSVLDDTFARDDFAAYYARAPANEAPEPQYRVSAGW